MKEVVLLYSVAYAMVRPDGAPPLYKLAIFDISSYRKEVVWVDDNTPSHYGLGDCLILERVGVRKENTYTIKGRCKKKVSKKKVGDT